MEEKNTDTAKIFRYVTFALFAYLSVNTLRSDFRFLSNAWDYITVYVSRAQVLGTLIDMAACVLIPVGILYKKKRVSMVGCILLAVGVMLTGYWRSRLLGIPAYILAATACALEPKKSVMLTPASAALILIWNAPDVYWAYWAELRYYIYFLMPLIVRVVAFFLLAFAFEGMPTVVKAKSASTTGDKIERLTKLKDLLDKGILTPEEFEEKKKQILDT